MKKFVPFIREGLVLLFLVLIFASTILYSASTIITDNRLFWSAIVFLFIFTVYCTSPLKRLFLVLLDLIFKQKKEMKGTITDIVPLQASCFSEKWQRHRIRRADMDYYLLIEVKGDKTVLLTRDSDFLIKNKKLNIQYGRFSHIVLNVKTLNS